jgi:hypothetical protein
MSRLIEVISQYPFTTLWLVVIAASIISMIRESINKRKNTK